LASLTEGQADAKRDPNEHSEPGAARAAGVTSAAAVFTPRQTARLLLRPIAFEDWPRIHRYMSDPEVTAWLPEGLLDEAASQAFAERHAGDDAAALAVLSKDGAEFLGHMVFHPWFVPRTQEIGWVFGRAYQGRGYATEAAQALLAWAFEALGCHRVIATCQPQNRASWRVMEKLGMRREAHFRACILRPSGDWWDEYFYAMLADEFFSGWRPSAPG
jgi:[ribosomal protein S5]-alanine N-acetyltransferase